MRGQSAATGPVKAGPKIDCTLGGQITHPSKSQRTTLHAPQPDAPG